MIMTPQEPTQMFLPLALHFRNLVFHKVSFSLHLNTQISGEELQHSEWFSHFATIVVCVLSGVFKPRLPPPYILSETVIPLIVILFPCWKEKAAVMSTEMAGTMA